jgi:cytochrome P450
MSQSHARGEPEKAQRAVDAARALPTMPNLQLPQVPGGRGLPLFGHTLQFVSDARKLVRGKFDRHGPIFQVHTFGSPTLLVGEPDEVRQILTDRDKNFSSRRGWQILTQLFSRGLMLRDFEDHRMHRRIMQVAFRNEALAGYADLMNPIIAARLDAWAAQRRLQMYPSLKALTLDMAAEAFLGLKLGAEAAKVNKAFVDTVSATIAIIKKEIPGLGFHKGMQARRLLQCFFSAQIPERRHGNGLDMLSELCRATDTDGTQFKDDEIVDHMIFLMMAAHDTTTSSISTTVMMLAQQPQWQERLRAEVTSVGGEQLALDECARLVETEWAFKEALRVHPPVPFIARRTVRECTIGGYRIPVNTGVTVSSLVTHFLEDIWSAPTQFDPERFSETRAEHKRHSHGYYPFGGGAHMCIGLHFATMQVRLFLHQFLRRFRVRLVNPQPVKIRPIPIPKPVDGLPVVLEEI